ncbi:MAG: hypothetical protein ABJK39_15565 [Hyphomicrobiales bacterium]
MFKIAKNPLVASIIAATALTVVAMATPTKAQETACTAELQAVDTVIQSTKLKPEVLLKVTALRESAIARNSQGDVTGCMQDVADIRVLLGG